MDKSKPNLLWIRIAGVIGAFEMRTVVAMTLRSVVWCSIAALSWRVLVK